MNDWNGFRFSTRAMTCLTANNIRTVEQVKELGREGLLRLPQMGRKAADEIWNALQGVPMSNDNSELMSALKEAWVHGYQAAVGALRELGDEQVNDDNKRTVHRLADLLEKMKP